MGLGLYDRFFASANGQLLGEATGVTVEYQGEPIAIATLVKDFGGVTPVPKSLMITVDNFVPTAGLEFDAIQNWLTTSIVTMRVQAGGSGQSITGDGFILPPSLSSSATDSSKLSFKWHGEAKPLQ